MGNIPMWKVKRETKRVGRQITKTLRIFQAGLLGAPWPVLRIFLNKTIFGEAPVGEKIAVFLLFQPNGIPKSLFRTIEGLRGLGYSIVFVCNGGIPAEDVAKLKKSAWRIILRPNVGYDFGGYRDGVDYVISSGAVPEKLMILNDTIWVPVSSGGSTLVDFDRLEGPYTALCNFVNRPRSKRKRGSGVFGKTFSSSFMFAVSREVFVSKAFRKFWKDMKLSSNKSYVVQKCEVGFSKAMSDAGYPPKWLVDHRDICQHIEDISPEELTFFLRRLPVMNKIVRPKYDEFISRLDQGDVDVQAQRDFARYVLSFLNPWDSYVVYGLVRRKINFIKKANIKNPDNARRFLAMIDSDRVDLYPQVREEIEFYASQ